MGQRDRSGTFISVQTEGTLQALGTWLTQALLLPLCKTKLHNTINHYCKCTGVIQVRNLCYEFKQQFWWQRSTARARAQCGAAPCPAGLHTALVHPGMGGAAAAPGNTAEEPPAPDSSSSCSIPLNISFALCICCCSF